MSERHPPAADAARLRDTFSLLRRNRAFARLYAAQLISFSGDWFTTVALVGLVHALTGSAALVALALATQGIPFAVFSPIGGYLADRFDRRALMVGADVARSGLALCYLLVDDPGDVWLAFVLTAGIAALGAVFEPASSAAVPNLVDREDLPAANVLVGSAWGAMLAVGGALGGLVAATLGREAAFMGDAASFALSAFFLVGIRRRFSEPGERERVGLVRAVFDTARYAVRDHRVLALLAVKGGFGLSVGVIGLLPLFALDIFDAGDGGTGILFAARGVGALIGPFLFQRATRDLRGLLLGIGLAFAVFGASYSLLPLTTSLGVAALFVLLAHIGGGAEWVLSTFGLQRIVPDRHRGRVFAFDYGLVTLTIAVSLAVTGWAADRFDPRAVMLGLAVASLLLSVVWTFATARLRREESFDTTTATPEVAAEAPGSPAAAGQAPDPPSATAAGPDPPAPAPERS